MEFKSQICTSRSQSERLLALGLKKETADMTLHYERATEDYKLQDIPFSRIMRLRERLNKRPILGRSGDDLYAKDIPAWSLHRLIAMIADTPLQVGSQVGIYVEDTYDMVIQGIEWLISRGQFNKDYLEDKK